MRRQESDEHRQREIAKASLNPQQARVVEPWSARSPIGLLSRHLPAGFPTAEEPTHAPRASGVGASTLHKHRKEGLWYYLAACSITASTSLCIPLACHHNIRFWHEIYSRHKFRSRRVIVVPRDKKEKKRGIQDALGVHTLLLILQS